jgi:hypothetical protein
VSGTDIDRAIFEILIGARRRLRIEGTLLVKALQLPAVTDPH